MQTVESLIGELEMLLEDTLALLARILRSLGEKDAALVVFEDIDLVSGNRESSPIRAPA